MDPLRSDHGAPETLSSVEREARIEQLLLDGLDCYFAHQYEQAINLWTRVLFLDRAHDRARAYIERARSAQAEGLREAEGLLHQGIAALEARDIDAARRLVDEALARGVSRDLAIGVLDRIQRLEAGHGPVARRTSLPLGPARQTSARVAAAPAPRRARGGWGALLLIAAGAGALAVGVWSIAPPDLASWRRLATPGAAAEAGAASPRPDPLPVPAAAERALGRARRLFAAGHLRDALSEIRQIPIGDPLHPDGERLRADIQRELLAIAGTEPGLVAPPREPSAAARSPE